MKGYKKAEIFTLIVAWLYLIASATGILFVSGIYIGAMMGFLKFERELFPGMMILVSALTICFATFIMWISVDLLSGLKTRDAGKIQKFRFFSLFGLLLSFILLAIGIFDSSSIKEWLKSKGANFIPTTSVAINIFFYHATIFIIVDALCARYRKELSETLAAKSPDSSSEEEEEGLALKAMNEA